MQVMKVYADFQNADPQGRLRLNCAGTLRDLSRQQIVLRNGLQLMLYSDDLSDVGEPEKLLALGDVEYSTEEQLWVAKIDWAAIATCFRIRRGLENGRWWENAGRMISQPAIALTNVGVMRDERWILHDIHWTVPAGGCAAILGPNGSGKTTLTRVIAGHLWPTRGDVRVLGEHFGEVDLHELRRGIRLVQSTSPVEMDADLTAFDVVLTGYFGTLGLYDSTTEEMRCESEQMLDLVGLHAVGHHRYNTLSTGERMRGC